MTATTEARGLGAIPEPGPTEPYLSVSRLSVYSQCGEKYKLSYLDKVPRTPQGTFISGQAVHKTIEWAETENVISPLVSIADAEIRKQQENARIEETFHRIFDELIAEADGEIRWGGRKSKQFPYGEDARWWHTTGPMMLRRYAALRRADHQAGREVIEGGIEAKITTRLPSGTLLTGFIDQMVMVDSDGVPILRDWKTGTWKQGPVQLATYARMVELAMGLRPVVGEVIYLRQAEPARMVDSYDLERFYPLVDRLFGDLERGLKAEIFAINPNAFCSTCAVRESCDYGRLLEVKP